MRDLAKAREYSRQWYKKNKKRKQQYRREHREHILAVQKEWYEQNREHHIAKVTARKWNDYAGSCVICDKPTLGNTKNGPKPRFCKDHRKEMWEEKAGRRIFTKATRDDPMSSRQFAARIRQEELEAASRASASFSHLARSADRDQDETNGSPPPPRKWASP